ncbi:MAG TPA: hypothetical protein VEH28_04410 [Thermoplasmata archaeon]|nr:hypothetical protein [Thermoplasmata archaeon]
MKLWAALYLAIWVVFLEFLLGLWPDPPVYVPYLHLVLGLGIVFVTYYAFAQLRQTRVPGRVKRIAKASWSLSILMAVLGLLLWFNVGASWVIPVVNFSIYRGILVFHVVNAIAIITQLAAVAIAFDMWEDHEFEKETAPGEVPAPLPP